MFNIGPMELLVLGLVGLIVLGPDRLPSLARDAARLIRSLREMATGARSTLRNELGPEFADLDLRNLNPRTALRNALLGDDEELNPLNRPSAGSSMPSNDGTGPVNGTSPAMRPPQTPGMGRSGPAPYDEDAT